MRIDVGERIKALRLLRGLTQKEMADRCELSKGFISQLESNQTAPSLSTLEDILQVLDTSFEDFFSTNERAQTVYRRADMMVKKLEEGGELTWLITTAQGNAMEPILITLPAGCSSTTDNPHPGEEFGYVLSGVITLCVGMQTTKLKKGDAFYFKSDRPHSIKNHGVKSPASVVWVSSPPTF